VLTALLFFVTLLAHEMSHALVARARGLTTKAITLFALGGVAQIEKEPEDAKTEFLVGIVGRFRARSSAWISLGIAWALGWRMGAAPATPLSAMFVWLGYINLRWPRST
jgi:Zn-dependent protease